MSADLEAAKQTLLAELREHALVIGEVVLTSGKTAQYYVDAKRALLRPPLHIIRAICFPIKGDHALARAVRGEQKPEMNT